MLVEWKRPIALFVGWFLGGLLGAGLGYAICLGFEVFSEPLAPPRRPPDGFAWWRVGGTVGGAGFGSMVVASLIEIRRLISRKG